jgi:hypothetical protein
LPSPTRGVAECCVLSFLAFALLGLSKPRVRPELALGPD